MLFYMIDFEEILSLFIESFLGLNAREADYPPW